MSTRTNNNPQVPEFNAMYELYDPCTIMFFFRNKHIMVSLVWFCLFLCWGERRVNARRRNAGLSCFHTVLPRSPARITTTNANKTKHAQVDLGTGNNNKINWAMEEKAEFVDIVEVVYRGARKGRGLVVSPKDYSTRYRY